MVWASPGVWASLGHLYFPWVSEQSTGCLGAPLWVWAFPWGSGHRLGMGIHCWSGRSPRDVGSTLGFWLVWGSLEVWCSLGVVGSLGIWAPLGICTSLGISASTVGLCMQSLRIWASPVGWHGRFPGYLGGPMAVWAVACGSGVLWFLGGLGFSGGLGAWSSECLGGPLRIRASLRVLGIPWGSGLPLDILASP